MNYNYWDLGNQSAGAVVVVALEGNAANVRLMDSANYRSFQRGERYQFFGGLYTQSPVKLQVPVRSHWFVVVDYGGYAGRGRAAVEVLRAVS